MKEFLFGAAIAAAMTFALAAPFAAHAATVASSGNLSITIWPVMSGPSFSPTAPSIACNTAAGTLVSTASVSGGDGNPIAWSMTGDTTDFAINASSGAISVGPNGIAAADCPTSGSANETVTVTATQQ
jgi:hypothetical protein